MLLFTRLDLSSTYWADVFPGLLVIGIGIGFLLAPSISAATAGVRADDAGVASATVSTFQQIGGSIATAVLSAFAGTAAADHLVGKNPADPLIQAHAALAGYTTAFRWSAGFLAAGALACGLLLRPGASRSTRMSRRPVRLAA